MRERKTRTLCFISAIFMSSVLLCQHEFITTWDTEIPGSSGNSSITIPVFGGGFQYDVDWNDDGIFDEFGLVDDVTHDFDVPGVYTIRIQGQFPWIRFNNLGDKDKIISIDQWGTGAWSSMAHSFHGCSNLQINATDSPNLSQVIDLGYMFTGATALNSHIGNWDVSNIQFMNGMFYGATAFNQNINSWDVSNVTKMTSMFHNATSFNQPLNDWDITSIQGTNLEYMFYNAQSFNQGLNGWDVSNVTSTKGMFAKASSFNKDLSAWNVANVNIMISMFYLATSYNQNMGTWNVENVNNATNFLLDGTLSVANYDALLMGWGSQNLQPNVSFHGGNSQYCSAEADRNNIIATHNWTIEDNGNSCSENEIFAACTDLVVPLDSDGQLLLSADQVNNGSWSTSDITSINIDNTSFDCSNIGSHTVTMTVEDASGLSDQCTSIVTIFDVIEPEAVCKNFALDISGADIHTFDISEIDGGSTDECGIATMTFSPDQFSVADEGTPVVLTVTDPSGNISTCTSTVTILPPPPLAQCQDHTAYLTSDGTVSISSSDIDNFSTDLNGIANIVLDETTFDCSNIGENEVTLTITNTSGQTDQCSADVIVIDTISPNIICQDYSIELLNSESIEISLSDITTSVADNCLLNNTTVTPSIIDATDEGENTVIINTVDESGNIASCTSIVTVIIATDPADTLYIDCIDTTIYLSEDGLATLDPNMVFAGGTNLGTVSELELSQTTFDCTELGNHNIQVTASNSSGNEAVCTSTVTVQDDISPLAFCQNLTVALDSHGGAYVPAIQVDDNSYDQCGIENYSPDSYYFGIDDIGDNEVVLTITDAAGNTSSCSSIIHVDENAIPNCIDDYLFNNLGASIPMDEPLSWEPVAYATGYYLNIGTDLNGSNLLTGYDIGDNTQFIIPENWESETVYYFSIIPYSASGSAVGCQVASFHTALPLESFFIPKFFTPNSDGVNDTWEINRHDLIDQVQIFDRIGNVLFVSEDSSLSWDGLFGGQPMLEDDYWYNIVLRSGEILTGHFSLIRD